MKRKYIYITLFLVGQTIGWLCWNRRPMTIQPTAHLQTPAVEQSNSMSPQQAANGNGSQTEMTNLDGVMVSVEWAKAKEERMNKRQALVEKSLNEWRTPIEFYGKVVDENTNLVAGAQVDFECNDLSKEGTSYYHAQSDANGLFSINGIQGKLLRVTVGKSGYYPYQPYGAFFYYAGQNQNFIPDQWNPVMFKLRKKGAGEPLVHFHHSFRVPRDGTPVQIDLATGKLTTSSQNTLKVECWTHDTEKKARGEYDWKCRISVVDGGLQAYEEEFPFLAPTGNYAPSDDIDMTVKPDVRWQSDVERRYFVQTADGKFGRIILGMVAGGDHFCVVDSNFNASGSRNLEPAQ